ncbi:hypothetical protein [Sorangium sp. So ce1389]
MGKTGHERIAEVFDRRYQGDAYVGVEQVVLEVLGSSRCSGPRRAGARSR